MGAWDTGPFDNDDALDWVDDLTNSFNTTTSVVTLVQETLDTRHTANTPHGFMEAPDASCVIAAAAWLANMRPFDEEDAEDDETPLPLPGDILDEAALKNLRADAIAALDVSVSENSELYELWEESDELDQFTDRVYDIKTKLKELLT